MIYNYIPVAIGEYYKVTGPSISYQYDVKQYLVLTGVVLPEFFLVDFCNEGDTTTMPMTGTGNTVEIPDACLLTGKRIKAYIVVSGLDAGASETRIEITLPVNRRPARTDITPTPAEQSTIDSLIEAINTAVEDTGDAKTAAETAQGKAEDAQAAAEAAAAEAEEAVGHYPKIENGTWWVWDAEEEAYVDTGVTAEGQPGQDGFSPIATVTQEGDITTISITDKDGTTTADIDLGPIKEEVEDLALNKADIIVDTAGPAAIANFPDGADNYPIRQLVATIEPVQDLHGYDSPWPPGGGKNKIDGQDITIIASTDNQYAVTDSTVTLAAGTYTLSFTVGANVTATRNRPMYLVGSTPTYAETDYKTQGRQSWTFTLSAETTLQFKWWGHTLSANCTISDFMLETGSSASSFVPYENICPITGHTSTEIWNDPAYGGLINWNQCVKNGDFSNGSADWAKAHSDDSISVADGVLTFTIGSTPTNYYGHNVQTTITNSRKVSDKIFVIASVKASRSGSIALGITNSGLASNIYNNNTANTWVRIGNILNLTGATYSSLQISPGSNYADYRNGDTIQVKDVFAINLTQAFGSVVANYVFSLEQSTKGAGVAWVTNLFPKDYYEYTSSPIETCVSAANGDPYWSKTIDFPASASTVYSAVIHRNEDGSGTITVNMAKQVFTKPVTGLPEANGFRTGMVLSNQVKTAYGAIRCNMLQPATSYGEAVSGVKNSIGYNSVGVILLNAYVNGDYVRTIEALNALIPDEGLEVLYELANPVVYDLTVDQMQTYFGNNNIWSNTGDTSVTYPADTKLYVDKKIAALAAALS